MDDERLTGRLQGQRRGPQRVLVGSELDDVGKTLLALDLLDRHPGLVTVETFEMCRSRHAAIPHGLHERAFRGVAARPESVLISRGVNWRNCPGSRPRVVTGPSATRLSFDTG